MTRTTRTLTALAAAATLGLAAIATPQPAEARGGAIAAGIIGGLAVEPSSTPPYTGPTMLTVLATTTVPALPITAGATGPIGASGTDGVGGYGLCGSAARVWSNQANTRIKLRKDPDSVNASGLFPKRERVSA